MVNLLITLQTQQSFGFHIITGYIANIAHCILDLPPVLLWIINYLVFGILQKDGGSIR